MKRIWSTIYLPKTLLEKTKRCAMKNKISFSEEISNVLKKTFVGKNIQNTISS